MSSPRIEVVGENDLSPLRVRDRSLTVAARYRHTAFPSRDRWGVGLRAHVKFHDLKEFGVSTQQPKAAKGCATSHGEDIVKSFFASALS